MELLTGVVIGGACLALALFILNGLMLRKRQDAAKPMRLALYAVAFLTILLNCLRMVLSNQMELLVANAVALICLIISFRRSREPEEAEENQSE